jgi:hypothetical protein
LGEMEQPAGTNETSCLGQHAEVLELNERNHICTKCINR